MFGLGIPEILFILLVGAIILGPEHMPKTARLIGRWSAKMRSAATSFSQAVTEDESLKEARDCLHDVRGEFKSVTDELKNIGSEVKNAGASAQSEISGQTHSAFEAARQAMNDIQASTGRTASDFLNRPFGFQDPLSHSPIREFYLARPAEVSLEIAQKRHIFIDRFELPVPNSEYIQTISLDAVNPGIAFCRIRVLPYPKNENLQHQRRFPL